MLFKVLSRRRIFIRYIRILKEKIIVYLLENLKKKNYK